MPAATTEAAGEKQQLHLLAEVDRRRDVILSGCGEACLTIQKEVELLLLTLKPELRATRLVDILDGHGEDLDPRISTSFRAFLDLPEPAAPRARRGKAAAETPQAATRKQKGQAMASAATETPAQGANAGKQQAAGGTVLRAPRLGEKLVIQSQQGSPLGECEADTVTHDGILTTVRPVGPSQLHRPYKTPLAPANGQGMLSIQELVAQFSKLPAAEQTAFKQRVGAK